MPTVHIEPGSAPPLARLGATATALPTGEVLLFGGSHHGTPCASLDRLVSLAAADAAPQDAALAVSQPEVQGAPPPPRFNHTASLVGFSDVVVFGGAGGARGREPLCDVALLDTLSMRWAILEFRSLAPAPRISAVGAAFGGERRIWIFGGGTGVPEALPLNDVHFLDLSPKAADAPVPPSQASSSISSSKESIGRASSRRNGSRPRRLPCRPRRRARRRHASRAPPAGGPRRRRSSAPNPQAAAAPPARTPCSGESRAATAAPHRAARASGDGAVAGGRRRARRIRSSTGGRSPPPPPRPRSAHGGGWHAKTERAAQRPPRM